MRGSEHAALPQAVIDFRYPGGHLFRRPLFRDVLAGENNIRTRIEVRRE